METRLQGFHVIAVAGVDTSLNNAFLLENSLATNVIMSVTTSECADIILNAKPQDSSKSASKNWRAETANNDRSKSGS